jgi:outer membrane lipoprotein-sorting protein
MTAPSCNERLRTCAAIVAVVPLLLWTAAFARQAAPPTPAAPPPRQDSFDQLYLRGQRANAAIKTLTARFTETSTSSLLTRPLLSRGRLAVERPARVVLRYSDPEQRVVLIEGNTMTMSWPSHNLRQTTDIGTAQGRIQKYYVNGSTAELRRQFEIEQHDGSDRPGTFHVTMVPKRKQIREALARLDLWVMRSTLLLDAMRMTFANGDTKTMTFEEVLPNAALEQGTFSIDR